MNLKEENRIKHLSIEGFDGVGKTTICNLLSKKLDLEFITKPFHLITDNKNQNSEDWTNYLNIRDQINKLNNNDLTSWFYCFSYSLAYMSNKNIITDRFLGSNYAWGGNESNLDIYQLFIKKFGSPDLTIILYASSKILEERIKNRNIEDKNLLILNKSEEYYKKMRNFFRINNFNYYEINTELCSEHEIVNKILELWNQII